MVGSVFRRQYYWAERSQARKPDCVTRFERTFDPDPSIAATAAAELLHPEGIRTQNVEILDRA